MPSGFKLLMLLSTPFPLHPLAAIRFARHSRLPLEALSSTAASRGRLFSAAPSSKLGLSIRAAEQVHTKAVAKEGCSETVTSYPGFKDSYSWPEWSKLADHLLARGYSQRPVAPGNEDDFLLTDVVLPEQFLKAAEACLDFARERPDILRLLTKRYIELVVNNGSPFLFKNGEKSVSRMRLFLSGDASSALESEKAQTIDIMCYLLSYMYKTFFASSGDQIKADESVETSVRKLLYELFNFIGQRSKLAEPTKTELCLGNEQLTRPTGKSFEIKRGDWICQKCTFLNFARNMSCLECGEARPRRQLTGAEWECPQCDFFNYGRNTSCLRCDCRRPGEVLPSPAPTAGVGLSRSSNIEQKISVPSHGGSSMRSRTDNTSDTISRSLDRILGRSSTPSGNLSSDVDSNTSSLGNFSSSQFGQNMAKQRRNPDNVSFVPLPPDMFRKTQEPEHGVQQSSGKGVASSPNTSDLVDSLIMSYENSTKSSNNKDSSDVSLRWPNTAVELENAKDPANAVSDEDFSNIMPIRKEENRFVVSEKDRSSTSSQNTSDLFDSLTKSSENSMKSSSSKDSSDVSLRWSKTAAELENAKDPANAVSDEDFPDIMPIRKGENRFVVSKKKDRSLTSPAYKRRLAMEQANNYNTVPFVPFPPGYFAKKDNQLATDSIESTAPLDKIETLPEKQREQESGISDQGLAGTSSQQSGGQSYGDSYKSEFSDMNLNQNNFKHNRETLNSTKKNSTFEDNASYSSPYYTSRPDSNLGKYSGYTASSTQQSSNSLNNSTSYGETTANSSQPLNTNWPNYDSSSVEYTTYGGPSASSSHPPASSWRDSKGRVNNEPVVSPQKPPNLQSTGNIPSGGYSGKSLEGSCVKETDPLDMSEEAKAERWFRRVAQIKDISELSQIPDEDFPEIMPMRKGVNRFVVSKRKTPLERRLTSPQYRRNLPIVSSETEKDDN